MTESAESGQAAERNTEHPWLPWL